MTRAPSPSLTRTAGRLAVGGLLLGAVSWVSSAAGWLPDQQLPADGPLADGPQGGGSLGGGAVGIDPQVVWDGDRLPARVAGVGALLDPAATAALDPLTVAQGGVEDVWSPEIQGPAPPSLSADRSPRSEPIPTADLGLLQVSAPTVLVEVDDLSAAIPAPPDRDAAPAEPMVRALPSVVPDFEPAPPPRLTGAGPVSWRPPNVPRFPEAGRVVSAPESAAVDLGVRVDELPEWWVTRIADAQRPQAQVRSVGLSDLIDQAIAQSPRIRLLQRLPAIAETQIDREQSAFDPTWRMDTQYRDDQEPVGNQLITGGPPVLQENTWTGSVGLQRRFLSGAVADVYQRLGFQNSNSIFFEPQDQGTATLGLDVTQPLAFGRGREFNQAAIVLAELQAQLSFFDYQAELQQEMVEIGSLYWQLLHARMLVLQIERSRQRAQQILDILQARASYDTTAHQISLAKAEVSQRTTEWLESTQSVREFEISLRDRIADQDFAEDHDVELLPAEFADEVFVDTDLPLHAALHRAMSGRWELQRQQGRTQIADRQLYLSRCGLAPRLDLVLGVYANGLAGESGINRAWVNQFDTGRPGYYGGFEFELPQGRRNAKAAVQRDQLQKQQAMDAYQVARNEVISQVKTAHSRVDTARQSRQAAYAAVIDMRAALIHLQKRWENTALIDGSAIDGVSPALALEQLLAGQRRLQDAEASLAWADLQAALARQGLLLAMGEVLKTDLPQVLPADDMTP